MSKKNNKAYPENFLDHIFDVKNAKEEIYAGNLPEDIEETIQFLLNKVDDTGVYINTFKLYYMKGLTLDQTAHEEGKSKERIRQRIAKVERKMRVHYSQMLKVGMKKYHEIIENAKSPEVLKEYDNISYLQLSIRAYNVCYRAGIKTVTELRKAVDSGSILNIRNLGYKTLCEIAEKIGYDLSENHMYDEAREKFVLSSTKTKQMNARYKSKPGVIDMIKRQEVSTNPLSMVYSYNDLNRIEMEMEKLLQTAKRAKEEAYVFDCRTKYNYPLNLFCAAYGYENLPKNYNGSQEWKNLLNAFFNSFTSEKSKTLLEFFKNNENSINDFIVKSNYSKCYNAETLFVDDLMIFMMNIRENDELISRLEYMEVAVKNGRKSEN